MDLWTDDDSDRWERTLVGTLILVPSCVESVADLTGQDFRQVYVGNVLDAILSLHKRTAGKWEAETLARELSRDGKRSPEGWSWWETITALSKDVLLEDDNVRLLAADIQAAHIMRRSRARAKARADRG